jgi:hypothetical protein
MSGPVYDGWTPSPDYWRILREEIRPQMEQLFGASATKTMLLEQIKLNEDPQAACIIFSNMINERKKGNE